MNDLKFENNKSHDVNQNKLDEIEQLSRLSANKVYGDKISKKVATQIYFDEELLDWIRKEAMSNKINKNKELDSMAKIINKAMMQYIQSKE